MAYPLTLPALAALSITGSLLGVQLGQSAIAEIDPLYLAPPASSRFFADLVPAGYRPTAVDWSRPEDALANDLNISGRPECFDCDNFVEADLVPETDASTSVAFESSPVEQTQSVSPTIERYMNYPITVEEAQRPRGQRSDFAGGATPDEASRSAMESGPINM